MIIAAYDSIIGFEGMTFLPFVRYVVTDASFNTIARSISKSDSKILTQTCFNSWVAATRKPVENRLVMVYRHTAFGDQLIMTGITAYMKFIWPDARIFYFCSPEQTDIWRWNPHIEFCGGPMPLEMVNKMHDHFFLEGMFECDSEPDQANCFDSHFKSIGFDPNDVPVEFKRPHIFFSHDEERAMRNLKGKYGSYILYHWSSSNPNRMYPPEQSVVTLQLLREQFPALNIVVAGTIRGDPTGEFEFPGVYDLRNKTRSFREAMLLTKQAELVIGPDSSIMHVAGGLSKPCISLWGLFDPQDRVKYYPNAHPIHSFKTCPHAPCRNHDFKLPAHLCRDAKNHIEPAEFCNALRGIAPLQIVTKAYQILNESRRSPKIPTDEADASIASTGPAEVPSNNTPKVGKDNPVRRHTRRTPTRV